MKNIELNEYENEILNDYKNNKLIPVCDLENRKKLLKQIALDTLNKISSKKQSKKKTFSFRLDENSIEKIKIKADSLGMSCNKFVGEVLDMVAAI